MSLVDPSMSLLDPSISLLDAELLLQQRLLPSAKAAFDAAETAGDDALRCSGGRWMAAMLMGDFNAAWLESDRIRALGAPDPHRLWDGESLHQKRVIVRCLHGLGDAVQMLRYAPLLNTLAAGVVWEVAPRLVDLARCCDGVDEVVTWGDAAPQLPPAWDSQVEIMELPYLFRTTRQSLPIAEAYCRVPPQEDHRIRKLMSDHSPPPRVGVVWAGGEWDPARSIPFAVLAPLLRKPGIALWSLQGGPARSAGVNLRDATTIGGDGLVALAASIQQLDLVITIDSLAAHLAGAMGKPVWVLLQKASDWRWLAEGDRSPWYPTMRLFRQEHTGDWAGVIDRVCADIDQEFA